ncbi:unnamed protein product [Didymodactylos carnosus]|uniref:DDE Tnp4 domain-containing protein n=1 Tax=Didymodactylos carnosus TaxID=1234261 RepID=A0A815TWP2_9BILA|nr:unnamed protein product [Didymodactylos carnosus]CAF1508483.1 unnamed protein product [Didymodactylos carnosus]CAF4156465.1 unnamed protein product [Didymodactylos carnosus]CAF4369407.1 unnamed protein product [Didymodactylos carnosus]
MNFANVHSFFHKFIPFPHTPDEIRDTIKEFEDNDGYPMCLGCVDGTHIDIQPPEGEETDYYNYKKFHSIVLLAVVDASLRFTYVNVGAPDRCNDAHLFNHSSLSTFLQQPLFSNIKTNIHQTPCYVRSQRPNMPHYQANFNYRLSRTGSAIERAFGQLKNRFRMAHKKIEFSIKNIDNIIKTICVLHNFCVNTHDNVETEWTINEPRYRKPLCNNATNNATRMRHALAIHFEQNPLV